MKEVDSGAVRGGREGPGGVAQDFAGFQARVTELLAVPPLRCRTPGEGHYGSHVSALAGPPGCVSPLSPDRIDPTTKRGPTWNIQFVPTVW